MKPLFECHLTYGQIDEDQQRTLEAFAKLHDWKTSFIEGDPVLGPGRRFFLTAHGSDRRALFGKMRSAANHGPVKPVREKIEAVIHDTKYGIALKGQTIANVSELQAGLWEDDHDGHHEVRALDQVFLTREELKAKGYKFAFQYGSEALQRALAWLPNGFPGLRQFRKGIETGPIDLRDALDAAFRQIDGNIPGPSADQLAILGEYTGSWFGHAAEVRLLLQTLGCPAGTFGLPKAQS